MMREAAVSTDEQALYARALSAGLLNRLVDSFDPDKADALVQAFVDSGAALVPTLIVQHPALRAADPQFLGRRKADDIEFRDAPRTLLERWQRVAGTEVLEQPGIMSRIASSLPKHSSLSPGLEDSRRLRVGDHLVPAIQREDVDVALIELGIGDGLLHEVRPSGT
jgi:hypothetical protein